MLFSFSDDDWRCKYEKKKKSPRHKPKGISLSKFNVVLWRMWKTCFCFMTLSNNHPPDFYTLRVCREKHNKVAISSRSRSCCFFTAQDKQTAVVGLWMEGAESKNAGRRGSRTGWILRLNWHEKFCFGQTTADEMLVAIRIWDLCH